MRMRLLTGLTMVCLFAGGVLRADEASASKATKPGVLIRIKPIAELVEDIKFLGKANGLSNEADQLDGFIKSFIDGKGIDSKRPLGLYGTIGPGGVDSTAVALIPITNEKDILAAIEGFASKPEKGEDGVYTVQVERSPFPAYFVFADNYVCVTARDKTALEKSKLLKPGDVFGKEMGPAVSIALDIDQIPEGLRKIFLSQVERKIAEEKEKKQPNESPEQAEVRKKAADEAFAGLASLVNEGGPVSIEANIDRKSEDVSLRLSLAGKPNSSLAKKIADLANVKSLFAGFHQADSAVSGAIYSLLPENQRKSISDAILKHLKEALDKESDPNKKKYGEMLVKALTPSIQSGEIDLAADLRGPSEAKKYTLIGGIKIKEGSGIEKTVKEILGEMPPQVKDRVKLDAAKQGSVNIHELDVHEHMDAKAKQIFGDGPIYVALRDDALLVAFGEKAQDALKAAIGMESKASKPLAVEVSLARLAVLLEDANVNKEYLEMLKKAMNEDKDGLKITASLAGGEALTLRLNVKAKTLKFIAPRAAASQPRN